VRFAPGTALLFRMDTWHRGTPTLRGRTRYIHTLSVKRADAHWVQARSWLSDRWGDRWGDVTEFIAKLASSQRSLLGFLPPGHRYWTARMIAAVLGRYPGMDMVDYEAADYDHEVCARI
jgi:hypothetical protein